MNTSLNELGECVMAVSGRMAIAAALVMTMLLTSVPTTTAAPIVNEHFSRTWARTDKPVADLVVSRTWMWGQEPFTAAGDEPYAEAPGGRRQVQYFDKSRMEINHDPNVPTDSPWYVTNGLLVRELMTGQMQVGDTAFEPREPARVNVAGDPDDASGVTYWFMGLLQGETPFGVGNVITQFLSPGAAGKLYVTVPEMASYGVGTAVYVPETNHTVATPFWDFMNAWGTVYEDGTYRDAQLFESPFYATGFPLTEAYWANVKVAGTYQPVLIQCFERRCLTYTPNNDPAWMVEAGNVGQHYFRWRHPDVPVDPNPDPSPVNDYRWSLTWNPPRQASELDTDDSGRVYAVSAHLSEDVYVFSSSGQLLFDVDDEVFEGEYSWEVGFEQAIDVAVIGDSSSALIFVLATVDSQDGVFVFDAAGRFLEGWYVTQDFAHYGGLASSLDVDPALNVTVTGAGKIVRYHADGEFSELTYDIGPMNSIEIDRTSGRMYVVDSASNAVHVLNYTGEVIDIWTGFNAPVSASVDAVGNVFIAEFGSNQVVKLSPSGEIITRFGSHGEGNGQFVNPRGVAVDLDGNVYVSDVYKGQWEPNRVQKFVPS